MTRTIDFMRPFAFPATLLACVSFLETPVAGQEAGNSQPNIVVILADDLGYGE